MNCSFSTVSKSVGSLHDDLERPFLGDRGMTMFSRATDSGTSSMTVGRNGDFGQVDELHAVELGDGAHHLFLGGIAEFVDGVVDLGAGGRRQPACFFELVGTEDLVAQKDLGEIATLLGH